MTTTDTALLATHPTTANQWVLASNNKGKLAEFQRLFANANLEVTITPQGALGINDAIEDGLSFVENAIIKARHASRISGLSSSIRGSGSPGLRSGRPVPVDFAQISKSIG